MTTTSKATPAKPAAKTVPARTAARSTARKPAVRPGASTSAATKSAVVIAPSAPDFTKTYKLLTGIDNSEFCAKVRLHLENGYSLHGSPTMAFNGKDIIVGQAVTKPAPKKKSKGKKK
jgi:hypothetical protein